MKKLVIPAALFLVLFFFSFLIFSCNTDSSAAAAPTQDSLVKRGAYLVMTMGCNDCHSPKRMGPNGPEPDPQLLLSGHPANQTLAPYPDSTTLKNWCLFSGDLTACVGPWGTSFSANLTPDPTGLGGWTLDRFSKAFRGGIYNGVDGARHILPPMPTPSFEQVTDADLLAIFTFLQSIKPIKNLVPQPMPPGGPARK